MQQEFLYILRQVLIPGGEFLFKTDHPEYYEWVLEQVEEFNEMNLGQKFGRLSWPEEGEEGGFFYPKTDFQILWESEGKMVDALRYQYRI